MERLLGACEGDAGVEIALCGGRWLANVTISPGLPDVAVDRNVADDDFLRSKCSGAKNLLLSTGCVAGAVSNALLFPLGVCGIKSLMEADSFERGLPGTLEF
jgi:hypothetical protein